VKAVVNLNEFTDFLVSQIGQPYVWGGQHLKLTPENYVSVISKCESDAQHRADAIAYCKRLFDKGANVLYAYDCSGLGMWYLQGKVFSHDMTANGMMGQCEIVSEAKCGYWVFRTDEKGRATHIGYMVSDTELIEAKGRKYGVVRTKYKASAWNKIGKPNCIAFYEPEPTAYEIKVHGRVKVREGNGKLTKKICTVGERGKDTYLPYLGQAKEKPYWYMTKADGQNGYISSDPKYTEIVEVTM
jgi:hypothetical protein